MKADAVLKRAFAALMLGAVAFAGPAYAAKGGNGHGHGNPHEAAAVETTDEAAVSTHHGKGKKIAIEEHDRLVLRDYISGHRERWCPPGLAKKHNGCNPPGQLKYRVGARLPSTVRYERLPRDIIETLAPIPRDRMYVRTGGDIYLMSKSDRIILDAVTLMGDLR